MSTGENYAGKKVIVGLTGRVGSAVAAFLLKKQGMDVIGVSIVTNSSDSFENSDFFPKCHIEDLAQVQAFCEDLKIPFYATDGKSQFEYEVLDPLLANKLVCGSNQSCFNCTSFRLNVLFDKMTQLRADYIATGHFCKVQKNFTANEYFVHSNSDPSADQSFLLSSVSEKFLKKLILPLGELRAQEVEKIAKSFDLKVQPSKKTKDFCFQENKSFSFYSKAKIPKSLINEGQVLNIDNDNLHGEHEGVTNHFITEKELTFKGLNPSDKDVEIIGYDFTKHQIQIGSRQNLTHKACQLTDLKLSPGFDRTKAFQCFIKSKFTTDFVRCKLFFKNNHTSLIELDESLYPIINGEVLVLFDKNTRNSKVMGQGKVGPARDFKLIDRVQEFRSIDPDTASDEVYTEQFKF